VPRYKYLTWEGSKEHAGDLLADSLLEASRALKERLGRQEFVIWPWDGMKPSRNWDYRKRALEGRMVKGYE